VREHVFGVAIVGGSVNRIAGAIHWSRDLRFRLRHRRFGRWVGFRKLWPQRPQQCRML